MDITGNKCVITCTSVWHATQYYIDGLLRLGRDHLAINYAHNNIEAMRPSRIAEGWKMGFLFQFIYLFTNCGNEGQQM